jgi:hypothetical protein
MFGTCRGKKLRFPYPLTSLAVFEVIKQTRANAPLFVRVFISTVDTESLNFRRNSYPNSHKFLCVELTHVDRVCFIVSYECFVGFHLACRDSITLHVIS